MSPLYKIMLLFIVSLAIAQPSRAKQNYKNFKLAIYCPARDVQRMADLNWLEKNFNLLDKYLDIDKVYLETYRGQTLVDKETISKAKNFFKERGIQTSGGITYVWNDDQQFLSFCITNPDQRKRMQEVAEYTASMFDEIMLDDFWFLNTKTESDIQAKGDQSWTDFRLEQAAEASQKLIINPAKKVNPKVKIIIKYPNWYDHFQHCGFNLEKQPAQFDLIYTGTETRDPVYTHQHLQAYESYAIMRYFENIAPGRNGGGWVDPFNRRTLDRYAEQINMTLFAKARELTLFCFGALLEAIPQEDGSFRPLSPVAPVAGYNLDKIDCFLGKLGQPFGIKTYKPYHSSGEDFLPNYIGMLGIPMEITPDFPANDEIIFLTEQASFDAKIVEKIKNQLIKGKDVVITSGLYRALQGKGIEDIVELEYTDKKALVHRFYDWQNVFIAENDILIPQIRYATNDSWELITALDSGNGYPIFHQASYANGKLYVLTIPDNFSELYELPREVLTIIKKVMMKNFFVYTDSPSSVSLMVYDNNTFIIYSFKDHNTDVNIVLDNKFSKVTDLLANRELTGYKENNKLVIKTAIGPHSYRVFRAE